MPKAHDTWKVLPHGPLDALADNLWRVEGSLPDMPLKRVMTVARRADGELVVHNAVAVDESTTATLTTLGRVGWLVVPNGMHRLDAPAFKKRWPQARVLCPRGSKARVEQVVAVEGAYEDLPADPAVELQTLDGTAAREGVMLVRSADGATVVFNDAVFNMPHRRGVSGWILKHITASTGGPRVTRLARLFLVKDREALRAHLLRLAETPDLRRVIVSHGEMVAGDGAAAMIRTAAATL